MNAFCYVTVEVWKIYKKKKKKKKKKTLSQCDAHLHEQK